MRLRRDQKAAAPIERMEPTPPERHTFTMQGVTVQVPVGWEARIRQSGSDIEGATRLPVMHAATVPLPTERADYGGGVVERLEAPDLFVSLIEFGEEAVGSKLYPEVDEIPTLEPSMFSPFQLQRRIQGQAGTQVFFTLRGRAFCLYVVLGAYSQRVALTARANEIVQGLSITSR